MTTGLTVSQGLREGSLTGVRNFFDAGASNAKLRIYSDAHARPANGAAITTEAMLAEIVLDKPCGTVSAGELSLVSSSTTLCAADGTALWARFVDGGGGHGMDADCGPASAADWALTTAYNAGDFVKRPDGFVYRALNNVAANAGFLSSDWARMQVLLDTLALLAGGKVVLVQAKLR